MDIQNNQPVLRGNKLAGINPPFKPASFYIPKVLKPLDVSVPVEGRRLNVNG